MSKTKKRKPLDLEDHRIICPTCDSIFAPDLSAGNGNHEQECPECDVLLGFHVTIEIDGVQILAPEEDF